MKKIEPSKKTKEDYKKRYGLDLKEIVVSSDNMSDLYVELIGGSNENTQ